VGTEIEMDFKVEGKSKPTLSNPAGEDCRELGKTLLSDPFVKNKDPMAPSQPTPPAPPVPPNEFAPQDNNTVASARAARLESIKNNQVKVVLSCSSIIPSLNALYTSTGADCMRF
jgi:hypothetical protein